jgi:dTDP-4-dehydrorhamnose reductase
VELSHGVLVTGATGQLGVALCEEFRGEKVVALTQSEWDVALPPPAGLPEVDLVLHAAAWTDVDGAQADPQAAAAVNVGGTQHVAALGAPVVLFSTDYVFDGRKREPYVESDPPNPLSVYGHTKLQAEAAVGVEAWIVRTSWLFGWTSSNFVRTMLRLGAERDEVAVVDDQRGCPTYRGGGARAARSAARTVAHHRGGRLHVGGVRGGDLRGGRSSLSRPPDHGRGTRPIGAPPGELGAPERAPQRAGPAALARRAPSFSRAAGASTLAVGALNLSALARLQQLAREACTRRWACSARS